ncbi:MAG: hypothetical protein LQ338_000446 [Usnochroma carphineum]|nr:MAG: hypothetical protein LQ338_000446 [Usnochroma carphineum]
MAFIIILVSLASLNLILFLISSIQLILYADYSIPPPPLNPSADCPSTSSELLFQIFTPCATWADLSIFALIICVGVFLTVLIVYLARMLIKSFIKEKRQKEKRDTERAAEEGEAGGVELQDREGADADDEEEEERDAGVRIPPPVYCVAARAASATAEDEPPAYYNIPRANVASLGASVDWLPGLVSNYDGDSEGGWRGKWNERMSRMGGIWWHDDCIKWNECEV